MDIFSKLYFLYVNQNKVKNINFQIKFIFWKKKNIVYKLKNENNNLVVEYTSGVRDGATPPNREQDLPLFDFDPCANRIINENTDVFNNIPLEEVTPADLPD